ncbi:MAG: hypothetical protein R3A52_21145 [Polyangiales bacterium]
MAVRGGVSGGDATRPDRLGVMFDGYTLQGESTPRFVAFEAWDGALDTPEAQAVIDALSRDREVSARQAVEHRRLSDALRAPALRAARRPRAPRPRRAAREDEAVRPHPRRRRW